jgi:hypothetical protein
LDPWAVRGSPLLLPTLSPSCGAVGTTKSSDATVYQATGPSRLSTFTNLSVRHKHQFLHPQDPLLQQSQDPHIFSQDFPLVLSSGQTVTIPTEGYRLGHSSVSWGEN